jgi:hypothetical protein
LSEGGILIVEIGAGMEKRVCDLFGLNWEILQIRNDLQGIPRTITAKYSSTRSNILPQS